MRALKISLWVAAITCLAGGIGVFLPMSAWGQMAKLFGVEVFEISPMFEYIVRLLSATYAIIGVFFVILAKDPIKYGVMVPFSGTAAVILGMMCAIIGVMAKMSPPWFFGDSISCVAIGIFILVFWQGVKKA